MWHYLLVPKAIVFISWAIGSGSTVYDPADPPLVKTLLPWIGGALEYANDIVGYFRKCKYVGVSRVLHDFY